MATHEVATSERLSNNSNGGSHMGAGRVLDFYFRLDVRSLGLFRIAVACVLIWDALARWPHLEALYSSYGVLPLNASLPRAGGRFHFSLLSFFDSLWALHAFFATAICCYLGLLVGWKTKLFHLLSLACFVSIANRNTLVRFGGDVLLASILLWAIFLPIGSRFSIDSVRGFIRRGIDLAQRDRSDDRQVLTRPSLAALAIVVQIALVYAFTAFDKNGETWRDGTAIYYALSVGQWSSDIGHWISSLPLPVLKMLTWGTLLLEYAAAPLILAPVTQPAARRIALAGLALLHVGIWLAMELGTFQATMLSAFALLLRPEDWNILRRWGLRWSQPVKVLYRPADTAAIGVCRILALLDAGRRIRFQRFGTQAEGKGDDVADVATDRPLQHQAAALALAARALPAPLCWIRLLPQRLLMAIGRVARATASPLGRLTRPHGSDRSIPTETDLALRAWAFGLSDVAVNGTVLVILCAVLISAYERNVRRGEKSSQDVPTLFRALIQVPQLSQGWNLFAPNPPRATGWWVIKGITESGAEVDPLTGQAPSWGKPSDLHDQFDRFWSKYLGRLSEKGYAKYRPYFADYLCRLNDRDKTRQYRLAYMEFYYCTQATPLPGSTNEQKSPPIEKKRLYTHRCLGQPTGHDPSALPLMHLPKRDAKRGHSRSGIPHGSRGEWNFAPKN